MKRTTLLALGAVTLVAGAAAAPPSFAHDGGRERVVEIRDDCDPTTFNAALGPGACVGDGDTEFEELIESLVAHDPDHHWRNNPDHTHVRRGDTLVLHNDGGEFHTFTEVAAYGPGCVPDINALLGLVGLPSADCGAAFSDPATALPPGGTGAVATEHLHFGLHHFMCMIHPWMQTDVEVRRR